MPERANAALRTENLDGLQVALRGDTAFVLGETTSFRHLSEAENVLGRIEGIATVDTSHATVAVPAKSPHLSLSIAGDQLVIRGEVANEETRDTLVSGFETKFTGLEIDHSRLQVAENIENLASFSGAPAILDISADQDAKGTLAAIGGDVAWQVFDANADEERLKSGLIRVLPKSEIAETIDRFRDVLAVAKLKSDNRELVAQLEQRDDVIAEGEAALKAVKTSLAEAEKALNGGIGPTESIRGCTGLRQSGDRGSGRPTCQS